MYNEGTIIALSSPQGVGAIGVLRLSGPDAVNIVSPLFEAKNGIPLSAIPSHQATLGVIHLDGQILDEVVLTPFLAPRSYTGETVIEISCHGSSYILQRLIQLCIDRGAQAAQAGEFTLRAFLNQKMDLSQAEAVSDLIAAESASPPSIKIDPACASITTSAPAAVVSIVAPEGASISTAAAEFK